MYFLMKIPRYIELRNIRGDRPGIVKPDKSSNNPPTKALNKASSFLPKNSKEKENARTIFGFAALPKNSNKNEVWSRTNTIFIKERLIYFLIKPDLLK